jgi:type IV pilus assembly protein PilE
MKLRIRGITLIELLIVMTIVGILAAIAIPSYRRYVIRANRADAKTALLQTAHSLERCYTNSTPYAYDSATCLAAVTFPFNTSSGTYTISGARTATEYLLMASPRGPQATDLECGNFQLTQAGVQTVTGTATAAECWRR